MDRLVKNVRASVNRKIFNRVYNSLTKKKIKLLNELLKTTPEYRRSGYNQLKSLPKNPTISHFKELLKHHEWLMSFGNINS
ncbi:unnamed protein product, partial [marine sediment metagenome]